MARNLFQGMRQFAAGVKWLILLRFLRVGAVFAGRGKEFIRGGADRDSG